MRIIIYLIIVGSTVWGFASMAQKPVNKSGELWAVWEEAEKKLEAGQFDNAIVLYRAYQPNFASRLKQAEALKRLYNEGQKFQRAGQYSEAINTYKKHRDLEGVGSLTAFEQKIDECIRQMSTTDNSLVKEAERRMLAGELAYKGLKKLRELDTLGAENDYIQARKYGEDFSGALKEQYEEGLEITKQLREWGQRYRKSKSGGLSPEQERNILESYRQINGVPVLNPIEIRVQEIVAEIEGKNSMVNYAQNCETDLLLNYIGQNKSKLAFSDSLINTLNQYKSIQNKISMLKSNMENAKTVRSAFFSVDSMVRSVKELPENVKASLELCIKNDKTRTFEGYANQARRAGNMREANRFDDIAKGKEESAEIASSPCIETKIFDKDFLSIKEKLGACKPDEAKKIWDNIIIQLADCEEKVDVLKPYESLADSIIEMDSRERIFNNYKADTKELLQKGKYKEAKEKYDAMSGLEVCNITERDVEIKKGLSEIKSRSVRSMFRFGITGGVGANKPVYKIANQSQKMDYGLTKSAGIEFSFIDHHNPIDLVGEVGYISTKYSAINTENRATQGYKLDGVSISLNIKIHPSNTNPDNIRPYFKIGREEIIPVNYEYENYYTTTKINDRKQLKKNISSIQGGIGLERQTRKFGFFVEGMINYGINGMYDNRASKLAVTGQKPIDANFRRLAIKLGFRFW